MIRRPPRSTLSSSSAASDVYKRQIISRANYTVTAVVHLVTDRLIFPKGKDLVVTLDSPTKLLRVATVNHQGGSLTLQVVVTTPDSAVVLARAAIQVRIAGTSVVGYLLTICLLYTSDAAD